MGSSSSKSESTSTSTLSSSETFSPSPPIDRDQKRNIQRIQMRKTIQGMVDNASKDETNGKVYIVYENIAGLQWMSPGDGEFMREIKHWRLVIQHGFDWFTLEYLQDSVFALQSLVVVAPFDPAAMNAPTKYHVGDLKGLSSEKLLNWIQEEFNSKEEYNVLTNNCHDFVHNFLATFEEFGQLFRTGHLQASPNRRLLVTDGDKKITRHVSDCFNNPQLKTIGNMIVGASRSFNPGSESDAKDSDAKS
ncbi:hypothetical protein F5H01DRAFT_47010 [Linnemannia elongata]|nr:hypothetical protein F5H01DRAFT_47010 [Linnemannia elongata]